MDYTQEYLDSCCDRGRCVLNRKPVKSCSSPLRRKSCLDKLIRKSDKVKTKMKENKKDEEWERIRDYIKRRDESCRLEQCLTEEERNIVSELKKKEGMHLFNILDCAHVLGKGSNFRLKYKKDNIVLMSRFFHSRIDNNIHPLRGTQMSKEERDYWWKRILGECFYLGLLELSKD